MVSWPKSTKRNKLARWKRALLCENVSSTAITLEQYWPRTAFWLAFHGFVKPEALDREANRRYSITPVGVTEWSRIAVKAWAQDCLHGGRCGFRQWRFQKSE